METTPCPRCSGNGIINHFMHVRNGVCFRCKGAGRVAVKFASKSTPKVTHRGPSEAEYLLAERAAITADSAEVFRLMAEEALYADYYAARECASGRP